MTTALITSALSRTAWPYKFPIPHHPFVSVARFTTAELLGSCKLTPQARPAEIFVSGWPRHQLPPSPTMWVF
jgi:hypothetical protein